MAAAKPCPQVEQIRPVMPTTETYEECRATAGRWLKLPLCLICGHVATPPRTSMRRNAFTRPVTR
jgi:hypothetical protein